MKRLLPFMLLVLLGTGCLPVPPTPEERATATEVLVMEEGKTYTLETTVFGLGGLIPQWFGRAETTNIHVTAYNKGVSADLVWTRGEKTGTYKQVSLDAAEQFILPAGFSEGETTLMGTTLLVLSGEQYDALAKGEGTTLNLGLFDETLSATLGLKDKARQALELLKQESGELRTGDSNQAIMITPAPDRGTYALSVDGKKVTVDTIEAQNWFGHYTILANPEHPLVLRVVLSPATRGVSEASTKALVDAGLGYHITKIE